MEKSRSLNNNQKKRVGILTLYHESYNYGGLLQAYALTKVISDIGYDTSQIKYNYKLRKKKSLDELLGYYSLADVVSKITNRMLKTPEKEKELSTMFKERIIKAKEFAESVPHTDSVYSDNNIEGLLDEFDTFVVGSDQIWNEFRSTFFLSFVPMTHGKISYAASMSRSGISQRKLKYMSKFINKFDFVSVRESSAKESLQPFVDQDIEVLMDPTFLLSKQEWNKLASASNIDKKYIFVYLLGENSEHRKRIREIANILNLAIVFIPHVHLYYREVDKDFADYEVYDAGPREFVGLIKNAEIIITDSFHGCVISSILEKNFWATKRHADTNSKNMNSRLYTLFENMQTDHRFLENVNNEEVVTRGIDYKLVNSNIEVLRQNSINQLKYALMNTLDV